MFSGKAQVSPSVLPVMWCFLCLSLWCIKTRLSFAVGLPERITQFSVWKTAGKDCSEACVILCQNRSFYKFFPSGIKSHSKIAQFNWECLAPLQPILFSLHFSSSFFFFFFFKRWTSFNWMFWPSQHPSTFLYPGHRLTNFWSSFDQGPVWCCPPIYIWVFLLVSWLRDSI